ncbi:ATP-binding protein [Streptomyces smyrnaeus]|uniref:ATP-binding protein n=1 Tax=Streptomyces smyrnaeus TaxID=1387713 RepID=UPI0033CD02B2
MYTNQAHQNDRLFPHVDLDAWKQTLAAHGRTPEQLAEHQGDANDSTAISRRNMARCDQQIPLMFRQALAEHPDVVTWARTLVQQAGGRVAPRVEHGPSLLLLGPTGVGKTHQAYGALRWLAPTGVVAPWTAVSAVDLYAALRPRKNNDPEAEFWKLAMAELLFIDDVGAERKPTEFTEEVNFRLVNYRYAHRLPTIFTSNVMPQQLADRVGDRVASRLAGMCTQVVMRGDDRRRKAA